MHTLTVPASAGCPDITINHNGDWSGGVSIHYRDSIGVYRVDVDADMLLAGLIPISTGVPPSILYRAIAAAVRSWVVSRAVAAVEDL